MDADLKRAKLEALVEDVAEGVKLNRAGRFAAAKEVLIEARNAATAWQHRSAFIEWHLAIAYDGLGILPMAVRFIGSAISMDRFVPPFRNSYEIIIGKARAAIHKLAVSDTGLRTLYSALVKAGGAGIDEHLLAARHYYESKDAQRALEAVDEALKLDPEYGPAQMARAIIVNGLQWASPSADDKHVAVAFAKALGNGIVGRA
jgi:tetratricopeptide (TPR) repeat protein